MSNRREFVAAAGGACLAAARSGRAVVAVANSAAPIPTAAQLQWQRDERALFIHFGINTFTDREWGDGTENPALFAPTALDARQWARSARASGFRAMVLTAKHHDGFCLWPTRTTDHSVAHSGWRDGHGDVVRDFVDACRIEGLRAGLYLSPWDRNASAYGDAPRYNDMYAAQLTELLTGYGPLNEIWFDGANGEGPSGRKQVYDWPRTWALVRQYQPQAVIFSDAGPDIRWIGNENGSAAETNWSTVDPSVVTAPGMSGDNVTAMLQHGDPAGTAWRPGETDVSIRPGWFHHDSEDTKVRTPDNLVALYMSSVGRNSKLLLNVPPTREGLLAAVDVAALQGMHDSLDRLTGQNLAAGARIHWQTSGATATGELDLGAVAAISLVDLAEDIAAGQQVARYHVEGSDGTAWVPLCAGTTIGYRRMQQLANVAVRRMRVTIDESLGPPRPVSLRVYGGSS